VTESVHLSPRLQLIFSKTKLVCFGRYAIEVPEEASLTMGGIGVPSEVEVISGGVAAIELRLANKVAKIRDIDTAEITFNGDGPVESSRQIRYYEGSLLKEYGALYFQTYHQKGDFIFIYGDAVASKISGTIDSEAATAKRQAILANSLRLRALDEAPMEPGFCIQHAFVPERSYARQETADAGFFFPSLPDVTFSISSNKDAYGDYPPAEFETYKPELSLLYRIEQAKKEQGMHYPSRTVLREGKRDVQHWHGEESLIKRADGVHDFEWAFVGTPRDVANPSEFRVVMFTKVQHNTVGAAKVASVTDDEAVALWDKLLSGLKFRVKVPGAPEGSYHLQPKH
jgi:hypothetical protein